VDTALAVCHRIAAESLITGYLMGSLCERKNAQVRELRETYHSVLTILRHFMWADRCGG
jgi:hypothetical protein